jgi:hypothetical protein
MAYSTNPYLPKARATAMRLLLLEELPLAVIADRSGVHRSTIWRWKRKWHKLNEHRQLTNDNRTIQTECIGHYWRKSVPLSRQRDTLATYLDYYNTKRVHLGIQMQVPTAMLQRF